ncbi:MAG: glycine cleavage system aminomethyltransferase GcvT [Alphaproteobacteria bacterium]|nr:glycine cleavage system aminomethyltransferase GcvT [Alphaproteobacteria bacterium]
MTVKTADLLRTPLYDLHRKLNGKMVDFAGFELPVQYEAGILTEHRHTRSKASLFDVSHLGQVVIGGDDPARALERLVPGDLVNLGEGRMRYTMFTNDTAGILDDLMIVNRGGDWLVIINAGPRVADLAHLRAHLGADRVAYHPDRALIALQGPAAATVLARFAADCARMPYLSSATLSIAGVEAFVMRSGYTGEDGFEISLLPDRAEAVAEALLAEPEVAPAGLGARDSLRLEAGLCLYGHDLDPATTVVEAGLTWTVSKRRRAEGGYPGAEIVARQLAEGPLRRRVGLLPEGRAPVREGAEILAPDGRKIGTITSGGFGPTVEGPVAMGYVETPFAAEGTEVQALLRGRPVAARIVKPPFVATRYYKG